MKKMLLTVASAVSLLAFGAGPLDNAVLHGVTDKERAIDYAPGEEMTFTLSLQGAEAFPADMWFIRWKRTGDDGQVQEGKVPLSATDPLVIKTKLDGPGFVRVEATVVDKNGKEYRKSFTGDTTTPEGREAMNRFERKDKRVFFDGGAGVKVDTLESVPPPKDFEAFWAKRKARLAAVPMKATVKEHPSANPKVKVFSFSVTCAGPRPVTGTYTVPVDSSKKYPALITFHGYGAHYVQAIPTSGPLDKIFMHINAHGYELEREDDYYTEFYNAIKSNGKSFGLDKFQNSDASTAYFGWMCYRIMRALEYLKSLPEWDGKNLTAAGGSMGGLQTMWAAGLDPDVSLAQPGIPWCCDMGGRETLKRNGATWGVNETEVMRYFDPVNMARLVNPKCRVEITRAGLGDYTCPPSGIAVLYNNLKCPKKINWVQGSTHGYIPDEPGAQKFSLSEDW